MHLQRLRTFVAVVDAGSINAAARVLSYTPPAISQQVATLEREVGCELLIRVARGVQPTPAGQLLYLRAGELLAAATSMLEDVRDTANDRQRLRVGCFPSFTTFLIPEVFSRLRDAFPNVELVLRDFEPPDGVTEVVSGGLDLLLTISDPTDRLPSTVSSETLFEDRVVLVGSPRDTGSSPVLLESFADAAWISGPVELSNRIALERAASHAGFTPRVAFETTDYQAAIELAARGFGVTLVPKLVMDEYPQVKFVLPIVGGVALHRTVSMISRRPANSPVFTALVRELREVTKARADGQLVTVPDEA